MSKPSRSGRRARVCTAAPSPARPRRRLRLEELESRETPATLQTPGVPGTTPAPSITTIVDVSRDGNYVLFYSYAGNLEAGVTGAANQRNLYWRDVANNRTELVTRQAGTLQSVGSGTTVIAPLAVLSGNGKFVAFESDVLAPKLTGDPANADSGGTADIFWWSADAPSKSKLVSVTANQIPAGAAAGQNGAANESGEPQISFDGQIVGFESIRPASDLVAGGPLDQANTDDLFRRNMTTGKTETVTINVRSFFGEAVGNTGFVSVIGRYMDDSGSRFAFSTGISADDFTAVSTTAFQGTPPANPIDPGNGDDIFLRDMSQPVRTSGGGPLGTPNPAAIRLVSVARNGKAIGNGPTNQSGQFADDAQISGQGNAVAFRAHAVGGSPGQELVDGYVNNNHADDWYANTDPLGAGSVKLLTGVNGSANQGSDDPTIQWSPFPMIPELSADGHLALFNSIATNLVDPSLDGNGDLSDAFVRDVNASTTEIVSVGNNGKSGNQGSAAPQLHAFSDDGRFVAFITTSSAQDLVGIADANGRPDVFVRDRLKGTTRVGSLVPNGRSTGDDYVMDAAVSGSGSRLFFVSDDTNLSATSDVNVRPSAGAGFGSGNLYSAELPLPSPLRLPTQVGVSGSPSGQGQTFAFDASGNLTPADSPVTPFAGFTGDVRTAVADIDGDGTPDTVYGIGPGGGSRLAVVSGATGQVLASLDSVYESSFTGGVFLAAGDIDGDGKAEIVVSPDQGGGGRVAGFRLAGGQLQRFADFFGIEDPSFRGGARVAIGDVNGDGTPDVIVAAGFGGGPRVAVFDGKSVLSNGSAPAKLRGDFFVFEQTLRNGVFVSAGDFDADGKDDLVFGGGPGGGPRVFILSGANVLSSPDPASTAPLANFFAGDTSQRGGVRVAAKDIDGDNFADLVTGSGEGFPAHVRTYLGKNILAAPNGQEPSLLQDLPAFGGGTSTAGVFVG